MDPIENILWPPSITLLLRNTETHGWTLALSDGLASYQESTSIKWESPKLEFLILTKLSEKSQESEIPLPSSSGMSCNGIRTLRSQSIECKQQEGLVTLFWELATEMRIISEVSKFLIASAMLWMIQSHFQKMKTGISLSKTLFITEWTGSVLPSMNACMICWQNIMAISLQKTRWNSFCLAWTVEIFKLSFTIWARSGCISLMDTNTSMRKGRESE